MQIDGVIARPTKVVRLDPEFFEQPTTVTVGFLPPIAEAKIREARLGAMDFVSENNTYVAKPAVGREAQTELTIRAIKLQYGVRKHDIRSNGITCEWNADLWEELDKLDPRILDTVIQEIDSASELPKGAPINPT